MNQIQTRADVIIEQMQMLVEQNDLELMRRYAKDLVVGDYADLAGLNNSKAVLAWCVGHAHTHLVVLGVHPGENALVNAHIGLASEDKFYKLTLKQAGDFGLHEISRIEYAALGNTPVPFTMDGDKLNFTLFKAGAPLAHVNVKPIPCGDNHYYQIQYRPIRPLNEFDRRALQVWAHKNVASYAQSLFYHIHDEIWHASEQQKRLALTLLARYHPTTRISILLARDPAFSEAVHTLFPRFEHDHTSGVTVAEVKQKSLLLM